MNSANNSRVITRTYELLTSTSGSHFSNGFIFSPPNLVYTSGGRESNREQINGSISINYPANGTVYNNGDVFNVGISGTGIKEIYAFVEYKTDSVLAMRVAGSELVFKVSTNEKFYNGSYDMWVFGVTESGELVQANQNFVIESTQCVSVRSGDWNDPFVWSCGRVPTATHDVIIKTSHAIELTPAMGTQLCKSLSVEYGAFFDNSGRFFLANPR
jgi:hypothetical protein